MPAVVSNSLSVDKKSGYAGDTFKFTDSIKVSGSGSFVGRIKVYVNDTLNKGITFSGTAGSTFKVPFNITFNKAGSYSVYTDASISGGVK